MEIYKNWSNHWKIHKKSSIFLLIEIYDFFFAILLIEPSFLDFISNMYDESIDNA